MRSRLASRSAPSRWFTLARSRLVLTLAVLLGAGGCDGCSCFNVGGGDGCSPDLTNTCIGICGSTTSGPCTCADGSSCVLGTCPTPTECTSGVTCGDICCSSGDLCWLDQCTSPGPTCATTADCNSNQICDFSLSAPFYAPEDGPGGAGGAGGAGAGSGGGSAGGPPAVCSIGGPELGTCLPAPAPCADGAAPGCLSECTAFPDASSGAPALKAAWGDAAAVDAQDSVIATPIVIDLEHDACIGPEIVFLTAASNGAASHGALHAIGIRDGSAVPLWTATPDPASPNDPAKGVAAARTPDGQALIAVCTADQRVRVYSGSVEAWTSEPSPACSHPSIVDFYGNGQPQIVTPSQVLHAATGDVLVEAFSPPIDGAVVVADVGDDYEPEIVSAGRAYRGNGELIADSGLAGSYVAVADLDGDGFPEIVGVQSGSGQHHLFVWHLVNGQIVEIVRQPIDLHTDLPDPCLPGDPGADASGGPPVLADFDSDGLPDVGVATARGYVAYSGKKLMDPAVTAVVLWAVLAPDCQGGRRGSVAFDFDDDGSSEVVYSDGASVSIFSGQDGAVLFSECNPSEPTDGYPVVADADGDGFADVVVPASSRGGATCAGEGVAGVRVFAHSAAGWARTRPVWNEHGYHITNVASDGTVVEEGRFYLAPQWNQFRANEVDRSAPNLSIGFVPECTDDLVAQVWNLGSTRVLAGDVEVVFTQLAPTSAHLGAVAIPVPLDPGASVRIAVALPTAPDGTYFAQARPVGGAPWLECDASDNSITAPIDCAF